MKVYSLFNLVFKLTFFPAHFIIFASSSLTGRRGALIAACVCIGMNDS